MNISFAISRLLYNSAFCLLWLFVGYRNFTNPDKSQWIGYAALVLGIFYLLTFLYEVFQKYIYLDNDHIVINNFPKEKAQVNEIKEVTENKTDYTLVTSQKSITIKKSKINKAQLQFVDQYLKDIQQKLV